MTSSFVVDYARTAGKVMYDSYGREPMGGSFSFRPDGTLDELMYGVEITEQGDIFGRHADLKTYLKAAELSGKREPETATFESHHLIPVEVLNQVGISADNGIAVAVDSAGHMNDIHGSVGLASGVVFTDVDQLKNYYRGEYAALGAPEWGDKACEFVDANRDQFASGLAAVAEQLEASKIDPLSEPPPETPTGAADMIEADADNAGDATISDYV